MSVNERPTGRLREETRKASVSSRPLPRLLAARMSSMFSMSHFAR